MFDTEDDSRVGTWELSTELNERGAALGLDENALASTVRATYYGAEATRIQRGRHEVKLMVRYPKDERQSLENFSNVHVRDGDGVERRLDEIADLSFDRSYSQINRLNQRRAVTVTADVNRKQGNAVEILAEMQANFMPELLKRYEERGAKLSINWEGEQAQTQESIVSMFTGFAIALLCMFILLTLEFQSYVQPLIILSIIPFGWVGAIFGHALLGIDLTLFSFFGLIALTGVVVNDSIVLVDFINRRVRDNVDLHTALMTAGARRFRPIMLTSMTTVAGLCPMLLETSLQAQVLIPMAASLIFGLATGTLLILILVPLFYSIYGSVLSLFGFPLVGGNEDDNASDDDLAEDSSTVSGLAGA